MDLPRVTLASAAALMLVPSLYTLWVLINGLSAQWVVVTFLVAFALCFLHILLLGLPLLYLLYRNNAISKHSTTWGGFVIGALPLTLMNVLINVSRDGYSSSGSWHGRFVAFFENGSPTIYAWLSTLEGAFIYGILGAISARVFWLVFRRGGHHVRESGSHADA
jgi:hypothetical protein